MDGRPRWPVAIAAVVALIMVSALVLYSVVPLTALGRAPGLRALPRAGVVFDTRGIRTGPAPAVPGARRGGTVRVLRTAAVGSDPAGPTPDRDRSALRLMFRSVTGYLRTPEGLELVGDLATNTGEVTPDGLTWTYHLRSGVRFSDGSPVTSADVARGIVRGSGGPDRLRQLLAPTATSGSPLPGLLMPDTATLVFTLARPYPQFPLVMSLLDTAPVAPGPVLLSSGPYRPSPRETAPVTLERNPYWDPATDPIRHGYPDTIVFEVASPDAVAARMAAAAGTDATAVSDAVPVRAAPGARRVLGPNGVGVYIMVNTARVTDLNLRRALNYAIDRGDAIDSLVDTTAVPMTTILPSPLRGPHLDEVYPAGPHGDLDKARKLLRGRFVPRLTLCSDPHVGVPDLGVVVQRAFARAGFTVTVRPFALSDYHPGIATQNIICDLIPFGFGPTYPDGDRVLGEMFRPGPGGLNYSNLDEATVVDRLAGLAAEPDRVKAAQGYLALEQIIMRDYAPVIPVLEETVEAAVGPRIATAEADLVTGTLDLDSVSVAA